MHNNSLWKKLVIALLVVLWLFSFAAKIAKDDTLPEAAPRNLGTPIITNTYSPLEGSSIDQIVETDHYVYILFGEHDGNVQVFNKNGEHMYSAYFYTHLNGAFSIAADEDILYVRDERHNVYALQEGKLLYFAQQGSEASDINGLRFDTTSSSYFVWMGSVWHVANGEKTCFLQRPISSALYQDNFLFIATLLLVLIIGIIRLYYRNKKY